MLALASLVLLVATDTELERRAQWLRSHVAAIRSVEPAADGVPDDFADLAPLKALIGDATIVGLGEATHGTREFTTLRRRIVRYLAQECGFGVIALEGNFAEGERLFEWVRGAPGSLTDATRDLTFWCWTTREFEAVFADARERSAAGRPLDVVGIDMQLPRASIDVVLGHLATEDPATCAKVRELYALAEQSAIAYGTVCAELPIDAMGGATLRVSAWLRTEDVAAGDVQLFARAEGRSGFLARGTMEREMAGGTQPFTRVSMLLGIPDPTTRVQFGVLLRGGRGKVWIDDLSVEADGRAMPLPFDGSFEPAPELSSSQSLTADAAEPTATPQPAPNPQPAQGTQPAAQSPPVQPTPTTSETPTVSPALRAALPGRTASARHAFVLDVGVARSGSHSLRLFALDAAEPPTAQAAREAADAALAAVIALFGARTDEVAARVTQHARVVAQGFTWAADPTRASREVAMADNLAWWRDRIGAGTKVIVWAHNGHVGRSGGSLGDVLTQRFGADYVAIATTTGRGRYRAEAPLGIDVFDLVTPPRASLEAALLASSVEAGLLDLRRARDDARAAWLREERLFRFIGIEGTDDQFQPLVLHSEFDGVLWIADTTPTTPLRDAP